MLRTSSFYSCDSQCLWNIIKVILLSLC